MKSNIKFQSISMSETNEIILEHNKISTLCIFSLFSLGVLLLSKTANLREQDFFEQDLALSYSFDGDTVSSLVLWLVNFFVMFFTLVAVLSFKKFNEKLMMINNGIIVVFFLFNSIVIVDTITEYLKRGIGEPRPSAFYLCNYYGYANAVDSGNYTNYYALTSFGKTGDFSKCEDIDAFMSWPSGHASTSFCSMLSSALILHYFFEFDESIKNILYYLLLSISTFISVSRVEDNKHHTYDIACGAVIGCIVPFSLWQFTKPILKKIKENETQDHNIVQLSGLTGNYSKF